MTRVWSDDDWDRLHRYVTGAGDAHERDALERWVAADPERRMLAESMRTVGRGAAQPLTSGEVTSAWSRMREAIASPESRPLHVVRSSSEQRGLNPSASRWRYAGWSAAAVAAVLVAATSMVIVQRHIREQQAPVVARVAPLPPREVATGRGERAILDFADGSRAMLGPLSRLTIPADFNTRSGPRSREVVLVGEAYFQVKHDSTRPFRVVTSTAVTEDVGTAFAVTSYPGASDTRVVVEHGAVALWSAGHDSVAHVVTTKPLVVLSAGDVAHVNDGGVVRLRSNVRVSSYLAWTRGTLVFDGTRLAEAIPQIERWYDLDIRLADTSLANRHLTGSFDSQSEQRLLDELAATLGVSVHRNGRVVELSGGGGGQQDR